MEKYKKTEVGNSKAAYDHLLSQLLLHVSTECIATKLRAKRSKYKSDNHYDYWCYK